MDYYYGINNNMEYEFINRIFKYYIFTDNKISHFAGGPSKVENPKIALIQFCLSHPKTDMDSTYTRIFSNGSCIKRRVTIYS